MSQNEDTLDLRQKLVQEKTPFAKGSSLLDMAKAMTAEKDSSEISSEIGKLLKEVFQGLEDLRYVTASLIARLSSILDLPIDGWPPLDVDKNMKANSRLASHLVSIRIDIAEIGSFLHEAENRMTL